MKRSMIRGGQRLLGFTLPFLMATAGVAQEADEVITTKSGEIKSPQDGSGQVVFYRPRALMWAVLGCVPHVGGEPIVKLAGGRYYVLDAKPGVYEYSTGKDKGRLTQRVEAGKTYFIICSITKGLIGRAKLSRSSRDAFLDQSEGLMLSKSD